jgi:hypothetical protein
VSRTYSVQTTQSKDSSSRRTFLQRLNIQASVQIKKKKKTVDIATTRILDYYILPCKVIFRVVVNFMKCLFPILKEYLVFRQLGSSAFASIIYNGSQIFVKKRGHVVLQKLSSAIEQCFFWGEFSLLHTLTLKNLFPCLNG